jgi:copper chaperone CopZ
MLSLHVILLGVALATPSLILAEQPTAAQAQPALKTVSIPIKGMACSASAARVTKTLSAIEGVKTVEVDQPKGSARVSYLAGKVSPKELRAAVNKIGFEAWAPKAEK